MGSYFTKSNDYVASDQNSEVDRSLNVALAEEGLSEGNDTPVRISLISREDEYDIIFQNECIME